MQNYSKCASLINKNHRKTRTLETLDYAVQESKVTDGLHVPGARFLADLQIDSLHHSTHSKAGHCALNVTDESKCRIKLVSKMHSAWTWVQRVGSTWYNLYQDPCIWPIYVVAQEWNRDINVACTSGTACVECLWATHRLRAAPRHPALGEMRRAGWPQHTPAPPPTPTPTHPPTAAGVHRGRV